MGKSSIRGNFLKIFSKPNQIKIVVREIVVIRLRSSSSLNGTDNSVLHTAVCNPRHQLPTPHLWPHTHIISMSNVQKTCYIGGGRQVMPVGDE